MIKGKGKNKEEKEVQTTQYKFLPNDVTVDIDYDNLDEKKEIIAIRQIVLPPRKKSNDSDIDEDATNGKKRKKKKKKKLKQMTTKSSVLSSGIGSSMGNYSNKNEESKRNSKMLDPIDDEQYYEYEEEEEESESEFEKSEGEPALEDIQIRITDDKETKRRKLREAYFRLAKQASETIEYEVIDKVPGNEGPSPDNPLIEILNVDLNLNEKSLPMPEGTLNKSIENTLDERLFKEMEWILNGDTHLSNTPLNKFFFDQLLMNYGLKKLAIKNIQCL